MRAVSLLRASVIVQPVATPGINAVQLASYNYGTTTSYGSNVPAAWRYATGLGVKVALLDDGFDPFTTALFGDFSTDLSRNFGTGDISDLTEPSGGFHGTTTSGLIGDSGAGDLPVGVAPNATIIGIKETFGDAPFDGFVQGLQFAAASAAVINNSWVFGGFGNGEPADPFFASWYAALQSAVQTGRRGLGAVITFAAGNDRADANDVGLQAINSDPRVIAVAASDINGTVAPYSNGGAGLLVAAVGDAVAVPYPGSTGIYLLASGTSYAAPAVAAITALMLSVNPSLGWRDVQEILADAAYAPPPSAAGFVTNGQTSWNGGGMHFSTDLGFGVIDANVAVNLARVWTEKSTSNNLLTVTATQSVPFTIDPDSTATSSLNVDVDIRIQHIQLTITDTNLLSPNTKLVLISPDGTQSVVLDQAGNVGGVDQTGGLDLSDSTITDNAFWGENAEGDWTLQVENVGGSATATLQQWSLTIWGDSGITSTAPLIFTPEFARLAAAEPSRTVVSNQGTNATAIDLIALPGTTSINLNGGAGMIDGVPVTIAPGLSDAYAAGSTGSVTLVGRKTGGSHLTGGDGPTTITGAGYDTITAGLGTTSINTGIGGSLVVLSDIAAPTTVYTVKSGGGDQIQAGSGTVTITDNSSRGDIVLAQDARLTFIGGSGSSIVYAGTGTVVINAGTGGGTFYAGSGGNSVLTAGTGQVTFYGAANGDVLTAAGSVNDVLIAGAGSEVLSGGNSTGSITLKAGSGNDTMIAGKGRTTFSVGAGHDSIALGGVADLVTLQDGSAGGFYTISGFRVGIDDLHLVNYAGNAEFAAIKTQSADGHGGSLMHLSDGSIIDLLGIPRVTTAVFV